MKTTTIPTAHNPLNLRVVLILVGVVIALISIVALRLELRTWWPTVSDYQTWHGWFSTAASQTSQRLHAVIIALH